MKKLLLLLLLALGALFSQVDLHDPIREVKLPNGKSQQDEILKSEHRKTLEDAQELVNGESETGRRH
jgi:hypothetical protein